MKQKIQQCLEFHFKVALLTFVMNSMEKVCAVMPHSLLRIKLQLQSASVNQWGLSVHPHLVTTTFHFCLTCLLWGYHSCLSQVTEDHPKRTSGSLGNAHIYTPDGHAKDNVSHMQPTLLYIGQQGHARLTILRLSINQPYKWLNSCGGPV